MIAASQSNAKVSRLVDQTLALPRPLLLAFDVDGTLAPIVTDPVSARVPPKIVAALRTLSCGTRIKVALVTGRDAKSLGRVIQLPAAYRAVEHGGQLLKPGTSADAKRKLSASARVKLGSYRAFAQHILQPDGARLELKPAAIAVHVRELAARDPNAADDVLRRARYMATVLGLSPRMGREVCEAEVERGDKAAALDQIVRRTRAKGVFYVGDDLTDYAAIRRAVALDGIGVFVRSKERRRGPRDKSAAVDGVEAVHALVLALVEELS